MRGGQALSRGRLGRVLRPGRSRCIADPAPLHEFLVQDGELPRRFARLSAASQVDWLCRQLGVIDDDITRICTATTSMPLLHLLADHHLDIIDSLYELLRWQDVFEGGIAYRGLAAGGM